MLPQVVPSRAQVTPAWSTTPIARLETVGDGPAWDAARDRWMAAFTVRLAELRPHDELDQLRAVAAELWVDVGGHDPVIAAEMEFEANLG